MTAMGRGCVKTPNCNGLRESNSSAAGDLGPTLDFVPAESPSIDQSAHADRKISSSKKSRSRFQTASVATGRRQFPTTNVCLSPLHTPKRPDRLRPIATFNASKPGGVLNGEDGWIAAVPLPSQGVRKSDIRSMGGLCQTRTFGGLDDIFQLGHFPVGRSAASARHAQCTFARPENHGLENTGSACHAEAGIIGGVP
jgi:hypothetical protein